MNSDGLSQSMLTSVEARILLERCCDGPRRHYEPCSVLDMIEQRVRLNPASIAVMDDYASLTYAQLWERCSAAASGLLASGQSGGSRVAVLMERNLDWIVALLAVVRAGCVYVPLNSNNPPERNRKMVEQAGAGLVIGPGLQDLRLPSSNVGQAVELRVLEAAADPAHRPPTRIPAEDDAYCIFTSGSTGEPKGILMPHSAFANFIQSCPEVFGTENIDAPRQLQFCEPSFDVHIFEVFHPLSRGGAVIIHPRGDFISFGAYVERLERQRVDIISPPTTFFHLWRSQIRSRRSHLPRGLRRIVVGGEMAQPGHFSLAGTPDELGLLNGYGPAETNYAAVHNCEEADVGLSYLPVGRPLPNTSLYVLDADWQLVPQGTVGEICIGGAGVARGYLAPSAADRARFTWFERPDGRRDRIYCTGDLGYFDDKQRLVCVGRADDQVKIQGIRVELGDIEAHLLACDGVEAAVVQCIGDAREQPEIAMYLELSLERGPEEEAVAAVISRLNLALPAYMVPRRWALVSRWPVTANGKIDRTALRTLALRSVALLDGTGAATDELAPGDTLAELERLWQQVRRSMEPVGPHVDLRRLETSSLRLGMFFAEVFDHFALNIPPEEFVGLRTMNEIAFRIGPIHQMQQGKAEGVKVRDLS